MYIVQSFLSALHFSIILASCCETNSCCERKLLNVGQTRCVQSFQQLRSGEKSTRAYTANQNSNYETHQSQTNMICFLAHFRHKKTSKYFIQHEKCLLEVLRLNQFQFLECFNVNVGIGDGLSSNTPQILFSFAVLIQQNKALLRSSQKQM